MSVYTLSGDMLIDDAVAGRRADLVHRLGSAQLMTVVATSAWSGSICAKRIEPDWANRSTLARLPAGSAVPRMRSGAPV
jgi:hypothetical protein